MADRIEREIEEILAKLEENAPAEERKPVSILSAKKQKPKSVPRGQGSAGRRMIDRLEPPALMLTGAGVMVGGLLLASFVPVLIWLSFTGVMLFLGAFLLSFFRSGGSGGRPTQGGVFWRDRYIEYSPPTGNGPLDRLKRRFRR